LAHDELVSGLEEIFAHGLAHDAESDDSDFHVFLGLSVLVCVDGKNRGPVTR
jgi:hypothetical protein